LLFEKSPDTLIVEKNATSVRAQKCSNSFKNAVLQFIQSIFRLFSAFQRKWQQQFGSEEIIHHFSNATLQVTVFVHV